MPKQNKRKTYPEVIKHRAIELYLCGEYNKSTITGTLMEEFKDDLEDREFQSVRKNLVSTTINNYLKRQGKSLGNDHQALAVEAENVGIPLKSISTYWYKGKHFSIKSNPGQIDYSSLRDELMQEMRDYAPNYPTIVRSIGQEESYLLVIDPADIHIGKLSMGLLNNTAYNSKIAVDRVFEGVQGILDKCAGYKIDKILFVAGNDILHIDNPQRKTANNTPQDTDGMWYSNYQIAKKLYIDILEILLQVADVHVVFNPSNHDFTSGFFLCDAVETWFAKSKNITFDATITHRKYFKYGLNLIGTTHGDGAKVSDLPLLMAQEAKELWGLTKHWYVYTHHVHHKNSKDYGGVNVESLRSPSGTDWWHHQKGFQGAPKAVEGFLHSKTEGQVGRFTHTF